MHVLLGVMALAWLPLLWAASNSFHDHECTAERGYFSFGGFSVDTEADSRTTSSVGGSPSIWASSGRTFRERFQARCVDGPIGILHHTDT